MSSSVCSVCNEDLCPPMISCNCCNMIFHYNPTCAGITVTEQKALEVKNPKLVYFCKSCKNSTGLKKVFVENMTEIKEDFKAIKNTFGSTSKACEIIVNTNKEVTNSKKSVIPDLKKNRRKNY